MLSFSLIKYWLFNLIDKNALVVIGTDVLFVTNSTATLEQKEREEGRAVLCHGVHRLCGGCGDKSGFPVH